MSGKVVAKQNSQSISRASLPAKESKSINLKKRGSEEKRKQYEVMHITPNAFKRDLEQIRNLKQKIVDGINSHKIFVVYGESVLRQCLVNRGWLEKPRSKKRLKILQKYSDKDVLEYFRSLKDERQREKLFTQRLLTNVKPDFYWYRKHIVSDWSSYQQNQFVNRIPHTYFTSKVDLHVYLESLGWFYEEGTADVNFPRCYNICDSFERKQFIDDFRITACFNYLKKFVGDLEYNRTVQDPKAFNILQFAAYRCQCAILKKEHEDIDGDIEEASEGEWNNFLSRYYKMRRKDTTPVPADATHLKFLYGAAKECLQTMSVDRVEEEGMLNVWIVKPGDKARGHGVQVMDKIEDIFSRINESLINEARYVVQKYIEKPLLILDRKFDIRQWFLVTGVEPLKVWMYKDSYLRFASGIYSTENFKESIHLCNNSVQRKYSKSVNEPLLANGNMWTSTRLRKYLCDLGLGKMWEERIYPQMRSAVVATLLVSQETMVDRKRSYQLFGADFLLDEDFRVWLLEINYNPDMNPTTPVTAKLCSECLKDIVKVVLDKNRVSSFECVYVQPYSPPLEDLERSAFVVTGSKMATNARKSLSKKLPLGHKVPLLRTTSPSEETPKAWKKKKKKRRRKGKWKSKAPKDPEAQKPS